MRGLRGLLTLMLVTVALAGCLGDETRLADPGRTPSGAIDHAAIAEAIGEPIELFHDHADATLHQGSYNVDQVARHTLGVELGQNGFADFVFYEDDDEELVIHAIDGDTEGGFVIADASDPRQLEVLGRYWIQGSGIQDVQVTPDGNYALMNVQDTPPTGQGALDCQVCIHVVDISDRTSPERVSLFPVEVLGTHNIQIQEIDGATYVFWTGQPLYTQTPIGIGSNPPAGAEISIARLEETPAGAQLVPVAEYRHEEDHMTGQRSFPHDMFVDPHPLTDQMLMYASWWEGGAITVDVSDPTMPQELDVNTEIAPSEVLNIHQFKPEPAARDGKLFAWSAPEIGQLESGSGVIRAYDVTDPADIQQVGTWALPGEVNITGRYLMSPHTVSANLEMGLAVVGHYHAGLWVLDITDPTDPRHLGYHFPVGDPGQPYTGEIWWKKPNFDPDGYVPNVFQVRWHDGLMWVSERGTGLYVLNYTGPVPATAPAS